ncbi:MULTISPECIES: hypothetical protein [Brenneria]|uniref:Exodeoxyribonuclease VIII-like protein n=1 Tax=Brenneria nigrifluens DSM 30175 = ATCC 13028 TaxID=1121120 RepID=A0A2U1UFH4_9GAMM|nr:MULTISPECIES: hypothetical protein [Brenneria]EHD22102.1 exodeoxyribonuclease VIII-like [Brenneria sp. EniD312]PWC20362.1 exodeoxyribonuclease VIII-like protein [Brenneria nigrifluens DSM 30175 = ATCC 13028]QCR05181.1 exodeoxyribonuclease VIII-like protein [Brenneria nigrifluens DSM 30175 = ATCC 13028]
MTIYVLLFEPKKSAQKDGAVSLATAIEAKNQKLAIMAATVQLEAEFPGASDNFFNPKVIEDAVGSPRPAVGVFDEQFPVENELIDGAWRRKERPTTQVNDPVDFSALSLRERIAAIALYEQTEINEHEFSMVCDYLDLPAEDGDADADKIIRVLSGINALEQASDELLLAVVNGVKAQFPSIADTSILAINAFVDKLTGSTGEDVSAQKPSISGLDRERQYTHTYAMLDKEIAAALVRDTEHCWELTADHVRESNILINQNGEEFQRWSMELRVAENALKIPRPVVFALIREGKKRPELLRDANARHQFVIDFLAEHMPAETSDNASNQGEKTEVSDATKTADISTTIPNTATNLDLGATITPKNDKSAPKEPPVSDSTEQQAKETLDQLGYGVYATQPATAQTENFQQRATAIEAEIESKPADAQENLSIWKRVQRTDPKYTKALSGAGFDGTSINSEYMIMRATEIFGPIGTGWGYRVLEEKMIPGAPLSETIFDDNKKFVGTRLLRDADGSLISELNHSLKILFWYVTDTDNRAKIESYGATPYLMKTKNGIKADSEVVKKSLTDAIKKALSLLGFSADVWLGMHDNPEYLADNKVEFDIKNASDKAEDVVRLRAELDEKLSRVANTLENSVSQNEATKVYGTIAREVEVHRKNAESKGDTEHAKYLAGRLRRLNQIKDERIAALKAKEGENA